VLAADLASYAVVDRNDLGAERIMSALLLMCVSVATPLAALGLYELQTRLERWDHDRHAED